MRYFKINAQSLNPYNDPQIFTSEKPLNILKKEISKTNHIFSLYELKGFKPTTERWVELEVLIWEQSNLLNLERDVESIGMLRDDLHEYNLLLKALKEERWHDAKKICKTMDTAPRERIPKNIWSLFEILCI